MMGHALVLSRVALLVSYCIGGDPLLEVSRGIQNKKWHQLYAVGQNHVLSTIG